MLDHIIRHDLETILNQLDRDEFQSKKITITGGAGFIGSWLCDVLALAEAKVHCIDNLCTGSLTNIEHLLKASNFTFQEFDVTRPSPKDESCDLILHFASRASPEEYQQHPIETLTANSIGTQNMLELARKDDATIVYASSSEAYGDAEIIPTPETYWGKVNPIGVRSCFDSETEILTEGGWKRFDRLTGEERVATLTRETKVEYHVPDEVIHQTYSGPMLHFSNKKIDLSVTPNHRLFVQNSKRKKPQFELLEASSSVYWPSFRASVSFGEWNGEPREFFNLASRPRHAKSYVDNVRMDLWLKFLGYYLSEGCVYNRQRKRRVSHKDYSTTDFNVLIAQQKPSVREVMWSDLSQLPLKVFCSDDHQFRICSKQLATILAPLGKSGERYVPREFLTLDRRQLRLLFDALMLGDGNAVGSKYYSKSKRLADDVQELALKLGMTASVARTRPGLYHVNLWRRGNRDFSHPKYPKPRRIAYNGAVHCVNVRNHVILLRRSGKPIWCGNCYDEGKRYGEALCMAYKQAYNLDVRITRIFNSYGPRLRSDGFYGRALSRFIDQALSGRDITVYGKGDQTRSFSYVADTIAAILRTATRNEMKGEVVNIGNPNEVTLLELAKKIKTITNSKSKITFHPRPPDDPQRRCPDISKAKKMLEWSPSVTLEDGLQKTIEWFKQRQRREK